MKDLSVKARVTLLCTLLTTLILALGIAIQLQTEKRLLENYYSSLLMSAAYLAQDELSYGEDGLEIDPDLNRHPEVRIAVFDMDGALIYGRVQFDLPFEEAVFRRVRGRDGALWYDYDRLFSLDGGEDVWLRCGVPASIVRLTDSYYGRAMLWLGPLLLVLAGLGGYLIASRAFAPVSQMTDAAREIADSADLEKRLPLTGPKDELYRVGAMLNGMLARLEAAFDRERRFSADVAHELRTPVTAIVNQSEYALSDSIGDADRRAALEQIHGRAEGMGMLIQQLLLLARMESGQMVPEPETVDLGLLCEMAVEALRQPAEARDVQVSVICAGPVRVPGDPTMLTQMVMNLIDNGIKYGRADGFVRLSVESQGCEALLRVEDDGRGMSEEQQAHIFERFYRADPSRQRSGTGLGLALCERIVALHSGRISVQSRPGEGSRFEVRLPLTDDKEEGDPQ